MVEKVRVSHFLLGHPTPVYSMPTIGSNKIFKKKEVSHKNDRTTDFVSSDFTIHSRDCHVTGGMFRILKIIISLTCMC